MMPIVIVAPPVAMMPATAKTSRRLTALPAPRYEQEGETDAASTLASKVNRAASKLTINRCGTAAA